MPLCRYLLLFCAHCWSFWFLVVGFLGGFIKFLKKHVHPFWSPWETLYSCHRTQVRKRAFWNALGGRKGWGGGTPWAHCYAFKLVIMGIGAYKVCGAGQCSSVRRRYPWQPCERPPPGTVTLNNSVEYLLTNTYLAPTFRGRKGWEKQKHKMARKQ